MLSWLRRRPERIEQMDAKAKALIRVWRHAYSEARQRLRQADGEAIAPAGARGRHRTCKRPLCVPMVVRAREVIATRFAY